MYQSFDDTCPWRTFNGDLEHPAYEVCGEPSWTIGEGKAKFRVQTPHCEKHSRAWSDLPDPEHMGR